MAFKTARGPSDNARRTPTCPMGCFKYSAHFNRHATRHKPAGVQGLASEAAAFLYTMCHSVLKAISDAMLLYEELQFR